MASPYQWHWNAVFIKGKKELNTDEVFTYCETANVICNIHFQANVEVFGAEFDAGKKWNKWKLDYAK
jgi:hypothetical protein